MGWLRRGTAPALPACLAVVAGVRLAAALEPAVGLAVALAGAGLALGSRWGRWVAATGGGLAVGWTAGPWGAELPPQPDRPAVVTAVVAGHWLRDEDGWSVPVRTERYRQGNRVVGWREDLLLGLPGAEAPPLGRRLRFEGYVRRAAGLGNVPALPPGPWRVWLKSRVFVSAEGRGAADRAAVWAQGLRGRVDAVLGGPAARSPGLRVARALVLGDRRALPAHWRHGLRRLGLSHLLAISGLHVGLAGGVVLLLGAALPGGLRFTLAGLAVALYVAVVGPRPSVLRATWMLGALALALAARRAPQALNSLSIVAAGLVLAQPGLVEDLGFRLTVGATAGILFLGPRLEERWAVLPGLARDPLAVSVGAQLGTLPWALPAFSMFCPLAPGWNLLAVPWTALTLGAGLLWTMCALALPRLSAATLPVLDTLASAYALLGALPVARLSPVLLDASPAASWALTAAAITVLLARRRAARVMAAAAAIAILVGTAGGARPSVPELVMLDVGQGEAILLRDGSGAVLVDGGGWRHGGLGTRVVLPALARLGVRKLDVLALTHPDLDHCSGLVEVGSYLPVEEIWMGPGWAEEPCARDLSALPGPRLRVLWAGEAGTVGRWRLSVLGPRAGERQGGNDRSLVILAESAGSRVLLTGDLLRSGEVGLLARHGTAGIRADVLKVAHHGSKSSSSAPFVRAVGPRLALISAGRGNRYGHPAPEVLERLAAAGIRALRTDRDGQVRLGFHPGGRIRIETPAAPTDPGS